jgi:hypothetical protein
MKTWEKGPAKEPLFPHLLRWMSNATEIPPPYTPQVYQVYHDELKLPVSVLNMHDGTGLVDKFLCRVLKNATTACQT